jgi:hypothetical protein
MKDKIDHLVSPGGGLSGEIYDLRKDILKEVGIMAGFVVEEFTNLPGAAAPGTAVLKAATATVAAPVTVLPAGLLAAGIAMLAKHARQITFTTAGTTPADAPANVVITGVDHTGAVATETLALAQTAATATSVKAYKSITSLVYPAADGTGATVAIGIGAAFVYPATATVKAAVTVMGASLSQASFQDAPRQLVFTTGGTTPADAPANVVITGKDINGNDMTETLTLAQTATTATSVKYWGKITKLDFPAADGTGATISIGYAATVGLKRKIRSRAGLIATLKEVVNGAVVTTGTFAAPSTTDLPNGSYTPASAANDVSDYAIYYDADFSAL